MSARDDILAALERNGASAIAPGADTLPPVPAIARKVGDDALARFLTLAIESLAEIVEVADCHAAMRAVAERLPKDTKLAVAPQDELVGYDWAKHGIAVHIGTSAELKSGISMADAAIAETGSLLFLSAPKSPTLAHFLPDLHFALVKRSTLLTGLNEALALARTRSMPTTVNFITGPSRSGDIEQTLELGAHGPRQLVIIFLMES